MLNYQRVCFDPDVSQTVLVFLDPSQGLRSASLTTVSTAAATATPTCRPDGFDLRSKVAWLIMGF